MQTVIMRPVSRDPLWRIVLAGPACGTYTRYLYHPTRPTFKVAQEILGFPKKKNLRVIAVWRA